MASMALFGERDQRRADLRPDAVRRARGVSHAIVEHAPRAGNGCWRFASAGSPGAVGYS